MMITSCSTPINVDIDAPTTVNNISQDVPASNSGAVSSGSPTVNPNSGVSAPAGGTGKNSTAGRGTR